MKFYVLSSKSALCWRAGSTVTPKSKDKFLRYFQRHSIWQIDEIDSWIIFLENCSAIAAVPFLCFALKNVILQRKWMLEKSLENAVEHLKYFSIVRFQEDNPKKSAWNVTSNDDTSSFSFLIELGRFAWVNKIDLKVCFFLSCR